MKPEALSLLVTAFLTPLSSAGLEATLHPSDAWEFTLESGYLWNVGSNTSIDYEIAPTQWVLRTPAHLTFFEGQDGSKLVARARFALLTESIVEGPEDYYLGLSAAPSIEWWFPHRKTSAYFSIGGGFGYINSTSTFDAQGQDFTLNWFTQLGIRQQLSDSLSILGGAYFLHHSNGGMTTPNPGIDALGFTLGLGWKW